MDIFEKLITVYQKFNTFILHYIGVCSQETAYQVSNKDICKKADKGYFNCSFIFTNLFMIRYVFKSYEEEKYIIVFNSCIFLSEKRWMLV